MAEVNDILSYRSRSQGRVDVGYKLGAEKYKGRGGRVRVYKDHEAIPFCIPFIEKPFQEMKHCWTGVGEAFVSMQDGNANTKDGECMNLTPRADIIMYVNIMCIQPDCMRVARNNSRRPFLAGVKTSHPCWCPVGL